ncbi:flagellin [Bacillus alkalicellulosilyticus]|uniref:flagellin N-terminal helical domain-containing protein n=1 Tax=Alkalihalobacterium alkalicellulosilyticum TaxID=1912214 RepID=UPI0009965E93|nr:flagellin [Bacillus alkalicellulosilyticus]
MIINNNLSAMNSHRQMGMNVNSTGKAMEKLSSGLRINRAGDDAAGLSISEKMRGQIRGLDQASRNSQDGISLIQTAEGALNETHAILQRMREIAVQSGNDTNVDVDRSALNDEFKQLTSELDRIGNNTQFNQKDVLKADNSVALQIGANAGQTITLQLKQQTSGALGESAVSVSAQTVSTRTGASTAIAKVNSAIMSVSASRSKLGAYQNRLEHTIKNLDNSSENLQAAESRIRDVDMAKEMMEFTRSNILNQASQAMLAQANQQPQAVLQLLR